MMNQYNQANALQYDEQRERSRARNDMARGDIYGAVTHRARAEHDHARRDKILEAQALSMGDYQRAGYLHREANSFENAARRDDFRSDQMECQLRQHRSNEVYAANRDRQHGNVRGYHQHLSSGYRDTARMDCAHSNYRQAGDDLWAATVHKDRAQRFW